MTSFVPQYGFQSDKGSVLVLVFANLVPLFGVLFWEWSVFSVLCLFWLENIVIGIFNVIRMNKAQGVLVGKAKLNGVVYNRSMRGMLILFFIVHYSIFIFVHGVFVFIMFGNSEVYTNGIISGFIALIFSHGFSYLSNYIGKQEYLRVSEDFLFWQPYKRIVVLHITILIGGVLVQFWGTPILALALLIVLKTGFDVRAHLSEHKKFASMVKS